MTNDLTYPNFRGVFSPYYYERIWTVWCSKIRNLVPILTCETIFPLKIKFQGGVWKLRLRTTFDGTLKSEPVDGFWHVRPFFHSKLNFQKISRSKLLGFFNAGTNPEPGFTKIQFSVRDGGVGFRFLMFWNCEGLTKTVSHVKITFFVDVRYGFGSLLGDFLWNHFTVTTFDLRTNQK